jgi:hypothetical protein
MCFGAVVRLRYFFPAILGESGFPKKAEDNYPTSQIQIAINCLLVSRGQSSHSLGIWV